MAIFNFASIDNTNIVKNIVIVEKETVEEALSFLNEYFYKEGCIWKNYNPQNIKHKTCSVNYEYVPDLDCYRINKSTVSNWNSWIFNTNTYSWEAPQLKPETPADGSGEYAWRETEYQSTGNGWVFFPTTTN
jgi:hypothetical protein